MRVDELDNVMLCPKCRCTAGVPGCGPIYNAVVRSSEDNTTLEISCFVYPIVICITVSFSYYLKHIDRKHSRGFSCRVVKLAVDYNSVKPEVSRCTKVIFPKNILT